MISAIQHYVFCPRQCGLIHIDGQWAESGLTAKGRVFHERVDSGEKESRVEKEISRGLYLVNNRLGITGKSDVVEFRNIEGKKVPYPVEYKSGKKKIDLSDSAQLCAQALSLEEMLSVNIKEGALFYGKERRRTNVLFDEHLRNDTEKIIRQIHDMIKSKTVPGAKYMKKCKSCSLFDICMPKTTGDKKIANYIKELYAEA